MCGIAGITGHDGRSKVAPMTRALAHRGPDAEAFWADEHIALGHRRLSIIDTAAGANQPMPDASGRCILAFNGEIYNYRELRETLAAEDAVFRTQSDTEVLLYWLMSRGPLGLSACNGMFALAFYDARGTAPRLLLARDRFGKKPLFYGNIEADGRPRFAFASELRAFAACPGARLRVDAASAAMFLVRERVPEPLSMFKGVNAVMPGGYISLDPASGALVTGEYWRPGEGVAGGADVARPVDYAQAVDRLGELLGQSLRLRLRSDVPLGVLLSGGVDSSAVAALARKALGQGAELHTFCVAFDDAGFDESTHARAVARHLKTVHHEIRLSSDEVERAATQVLEHLDNPLADAGVFPYALLAQAVRQHVTVALGGDGGDEVFAGYEPFDVWGRGRWMRRLVGWNGLWRPLKALAERRQPREGYMPFGYKLATALRGAPYGDSERLFAWTAGWMPGELASCARGDLRAALPSCDFAGDNRRAWLDAGNKDDVQRLARVFRATFMREVLQKVDTASMAHGLEVRAPLLDPDVAAFVEGLPGSWLWQGTWRGKRILKDLVRPLLPPGVLDRPKQGFSAPVYTWLKSGPLAQPLREALEAPGFRGLGWFDHGRLQRLVDEHQQGRRNHRKRLLPLLMLAHWHRRWMAP